MTVPPPEPALADALRVILPGEERTALLRACLLSGAAGRSAWEAWRERTGDAKKTFEDDHTGLKGLLPLVQAALDRNGVTGDRPMLTYARAARLREELRSKVYREICGRVLAALAVADVPVIALKACVVAETAYESPAIRHCHAVDLLVLDALDGVPPAGARGLIALLHHVAELFARATGGKAARDGHRGRALGNEEVAGTLRVGVLNHGR